MTTLRFGDIYNQTSDVLDATSRAVRFSLIANELARYKKNMEVRSIRPKHRRLKAAACFILIVVFGLVTYRIFQEIFVIDWWLGIYGLIVGFMIFTAFFCSYTMYKDPALQKPKVHQPQAKWTPLVSAVIAVKNDQYVIADTVNSCLNSSYANLEVIVVNDGSDDDGATKAAINHIRAQNLHRVKAVHLETNQGKRKAIRIGIRDHAKGEILILLDSDTIVEQDAIRNLVKCMANDPELGAVVGYCRPFNSEVNRLTKAEDTWYHGAFSVSKGMEAALGTVTCCSGTLSAYRMEAVLPALDMWAEDKFLGVEFMPGDDRQLTAMVIGGTKHYVDPNEKQWTTTYCESAVSMSEVPTTFRKFVKQQIRWKKSWVRVFWFTAPYFWKNRNPVSTVYYYLQMGISFIAPLIALRNLVIIPLTGGGWDSAILYIAGLMALSLLFGVDYVLYNPGSGQRWVYRLFITLLSVNVLHWLLYYAMWTMKKGGWGTR
jgi:hyaluronan synthase